MQFIITEEQNGMLLRDFLKKHCKLSHRMTKRLKYSEGGLTVNGESVTVRRMLKTGDVLSLAAEDTVSTEKIRPVDLPIDILYEDEDKTIPVIKYESIDFGGALRSYAYEYTYSYNGESYYVYQVIAIDGWVMNYKGYVFTFVTNIENKEAHTEELQKILSKVDFE